MKKFKANFTPTLGELSKARAWLSCVLPEFFIQYGLETPDEDFVNKIVLCLSEVMANTVDYADPAAREIKTHLVLKGKAVCLEIEDDGAPFLNFEQALKSARGVHNVPTLDGRGRGLYLIGEMCTDLQYTVKTNDKNSFNKMVLKYDPSR